MSRRWSAAKRPGLFTRLPVLGKLANYFDLKNP